MIIKKVACTKNWKLKKLRKNSQKQNINVHANHANSEVNKGKLKCYRSGYASHLGNVYTYINTICKVCKKWVHLSKIFLSKINNSHNQMNI